MSPDRKTTRRTGSERQGGRAADVVARVVAATFDELSRVGYAAMRVEDIAARSGVNKTTIYRRWPTKAELLTTAVVESSKVRMPRTDTGTLRGDLHASLSAAFDLKPYEQGVLRVMQMERSLPDVGAFAQRMRDELREMRMAMVRRGIARGELPRGVDIALVVELISAPVQRALLFNETLDSAGIHRMLDVVLAGAAADATVRASRRTPRGTRSTSRSAAAARPAKTPKRR
ncbi:MAG: TetR/AcrR family transcriptional regulator [Polyangiales bacterium]